MTLYYSAAFIFNLDLSLILTLELTVFSISLHNVMYLTCVACRVSQGHLLPVLWRTSLDESEMVQYLAKAQTQRSSEGRGSRKRSAPTDTMEAETPRAAKRRKGKVLLYVQCFIGTQIIKWVFFSVHCIVHFETFSL